MQGVGRIWGGSPFQQGGRRFPLNVDIYDDRYVISAERTAWIPMVAINSNIFVCGALLSLCT